MNWQSDPELFRQEMERRTRRGLQRTAIIWMPLFIAALIAFGIFVVVPLLQGHGLRLFPFFIFGGLAFLFGFQSISAIRDLREGPRTTRGVVARAWRARDSMVFRTYYIRLHTREILRGDHTFHGHIRNGDHIEVTYFRRSSVIIECNVLEQPPIEHGDDRGDTVVIPEARRGEVAADGEGDLRRRLGL